MHFPPIKLEPPERLAVVLALEDWRHCLEAAEHPFIVWTDHKNLSYIQTAKHLTARQERWALFLRIFNFTITYCPGSRNGKPDALSRQFSAEDTAADPAHRASLLLHRSSHLGNRGQGPPGPVHTV